MTAFIKLLSLSLKNDYKIIIVHTLPEFLVFVASINKLFGAKLILDGRDITVDLVSSRWHGPCLIILKLFARLVEMCCVHFCDVVITASNGFRRSLIARCGNPEKIAVMINTADEKIFQYMGQKEFAPIEKNARLIYHGTVSNRFGVFVAVQAMQIICNSIPGSTLHVYGIYDSNYRRKIEKFISEAQIADNVYLNDVLPLEQIYSQIQTMDLGIVPYLSDHFMNIALSTKMFEYIASGLPVVASRLKSGEELFNDSCVHYFEPGSVQNLAERVLELCVDPELRAEKRESAYNVFKSKYTSEIQSRQYIKIIANQLGIEDLVFVNAS
jgi:glycosyltransferase involved in cell wall biosynthesis